MKLNTQDIEHLADLSRLELTEAEITQFRDQLSSILEYEDKLRQVDISDTNPANELTIRDHPVRLDVAKPSDNAAEIIAQSPVHRNNFIVVPPVFPQSDNPPAGQSSEPS